MSRWICVCVGFACLHGCASQNKTDGGETTQQASLDDVASQETATPAAAPGGLEQWDESVAADGSSDSGEIAFAWDDRVAPAAAGSGERTIDPDAPVVPGIEGGSDDDLSGDLEGFAWAGDRQEARYDRDRPAPRAGDDSELQGLSPIESTTPRETTDRDSGDGAEAVAATALLIDIDDLANDDPPAEMPETMDDEAVLVDIEETMDDEAVLVDIEETMDDEAVLVDIEDTMDDEAALVDIEETMDDEAALVDVEETMDEVPVEELVVVETIVDENAMTPFAPMDADEAEDGEIVWMTALTAEEIAEQLLLAEEAEAIAAAEAEQAVTEMESEPEIVDLVETDRVAEHDPAANPDDFDEEAALAAAAAAAALLAVEGDDDAEPEPEPEPVTETVTFVDVEDLMADDTEAPAEIVVVDIVEDPDGITYEEYAEIFAPPAAATAPPAKPVLAWKVTTPNGKMPPVKGLPRLDGTVGVVGSSDDWVYRSLLDTLVSAGSDPVSGRNSDLAVAVRREPRAAFQAPKTHTIGVTLPYHRGRSDLPRTRWLATVEVIIDTWDGNESLREVAIRVGSQGITGRDFDRDDLRRLREVVTQWADTVGPQLSGQ